jgi:hypothetical protein
LANEFIDEFRHKRWIFIRQRIFYPAKFKGVPAGDVLNDSLASLVSNARRVFVLFSCHKEYFVTIANSRKYG